MMNNSIPTEIAIIAGKGAYPLLLAESAKKQGVKKVFAIAFHKETKPAIEQHADEVKWIHLGKFGKMMDTLAETGIKHAVMAGQITPTSLFRVRMDNRMLELLKTLKERNAETIFGAIANELKNIGIELMPASAFMEAHMPKAGLLSSRAPTEAEELDIKLGCKIAKASSDLDIGQTVVLKQGTILAVEAFEGTDETIKRAGKLGGAGIVIVKVAKQDHDMRFDIPVIGMNTVKLLKKIKASVLAIEAGRSILLERDKIIDEINRLGIALVAVSTKDHQGA